MRSSEQNYLQKRMNTHAHLKKLKPVHLNISREGASRLGSVQYVSPFQSFFHNISEGYYFVMIISAFRLMHYSVVNRALGLEKCNEDFDHSYATFYTTVGKSFCLPWTSICDLLPTFIT